MSVFVQAPLLDVAGQVQYTAPAAPAEREKEADQARDARPSTQTSYDQKQRAVPPSFKCQVVGPEKQGALLEGELKQPQTAIPSPAVINSHDDVPRGLPGYTCWVIRSGEFDADGLLVPRPIDESPAGTLAYLLAYPR